MSATTSYIDGQWCLHALRIALLCHSKGIAKISLCPLGHSCLHFSWLMIVLHRVFLHDAKSIVKQGISDCLNMSVDSSPLLQQENWNVS